MFKNSSPFTKLVLTAFIMLVSYLVFFISGSLLALIIFKINIFKDAISIINDQKGAFINEMKYFQIVQSVGMFVVPPLILARLFNQSIAEFLQLKRSPEVSSVILIFTAIIFSYPVINFFTSLNSHLDLPRFLAPIEEWMRDTEDYAGKITDRFLEVSTFSGLMVNLLMIAVVPAVGEELLFRGILQPVFTDWTNNKHWGIFISSVIFSAFHLQFFGFLPRLLLGLLFGYLLLWSRSLWLPILAHFFNNSFAVLFCFFAGKELTDKFDKVGTGVSVSSDIFPLIISTGVASWLVFLIFRKYKRVL